jgi:hypothetical protein
MKTNRHAIRLLKLSEHVYRALLVLYPADFRQVYGSYMLQAFRDLCRDAYHRGGAWELANWWMDALFDFLQTLITEHRKVSFTMSQTKFIQWSGWLCILGGIFFAASSISQLQAAFQTYQLSIAALVPGMILITLGMLGIFLRYNAHINLFGKLALLAALVGAAIASIGWLLTLTVANSFSNVFIVGLLLYLAGYTVFGGFAATTNLLPRWNFALLIGSALPLTVVVLGFSNQQQLSAAYWGTFIMLLLMGVSWILTGVALNSKSNVVVASATTA